MRHFIRFFGVFFILTLSLSLKAQMLWEEHFDIPDKGISIAEDGSVTFDLSGVEWNIDTMGCSFSDENDYAKTVSTSGGRFDVLDSDGEVKWYSPVIDIEGYDVVNASFRTWETGSSENADKKYLKAFYILNGNHPEPFEPDSMVSGNWDETLLVQSGLQGENLQLLICLNSSYANDKVIIDDVMVEGIDSALLRPSLVKVVEAPAFAFPGDTFAISAAVFNALDEIVDDSGFGLTLAGEGLSILSNNRSNGLFTWHVSSNDPGKVHYSIVSVTHDVEEADGEITVYDVSGRIVWEDFENASLQNWDTGGQWQIDSVGAIAGIFSARHIESDEGGFSVLSYNKLTEDIIVGASELLFSFKISNSGWAPSSSNYFYFRIGNEGFNTGLAIGVNAQGSTERVTVWNVENGEVENLLAETGFVWAENTTAQIDLILQPRGNCTLSVRNNADEAFFESPFFYNSTGSIQQLELVFNYSKTRSGGLWFDDFLIVGQNTPPIVSTVEVIDAGVLKVAFNEPVFGEKMETGSFGITGADGGRYGINNVEVADSVSVIIYTDEIEGFQLELSAFNIEDMEGTINPLSSFNFQYLLPVEPFDVVFNEIMADPNPPVGLPEAEYLEIVNLSGKYINLEGWELTVKTTDFELPGVILPPHEYLVICPRADTAFFARWGNVCGLSRFPSLLNSGTFLKLTAPGNVIVDELHYSDNWYSDTEKDDGGWSLEKIDPGRNCGNRGNWVASVDTSGGTPGRQNSVYAENPDLAAPLLETVEVVSANAIKLSFSEPVDSLSILQSGNIGIEGLGVQDVFPESNGFTVVIIFDEKIEINREYVVSINELADECGNIATEQTGRFSLIVLQPGDVAINEVLFNPFGNGADFVELYNCSGLTLDLSKLYLANRDDTLGLRSVYALSGVYAPFYDQSLLAFTADSGNIAATYPVLYPENIVQAERLPAYYNDEGRVVLIDDSLTVIDEFVYNESMHSEWLTDYDGISLERVSVEAATNDEGNWHSASSLCGWATPGYDNSQVEIPEEVSLEVTIEPDAISPNGDGFHDELTLTFQLDGPDYLANVFVFDAAGREVHRLLNNQLPANGCTLVFDGRNSNGELLKPGIYILFTELFHPSGKKKSFKNAFLITDRL
ncbi:MAG: lamin tail domain-containing protein [Prolixibacteraceae bacterium]|nr:lamin tail domain-containing protein [Prolixibacteraceae bacterium]